MVQFELTLGNMVKMREASGQLNFEVAADPQSSDDDSGTDSDDADASPSEVLRVCVFGASLRFARELVSSAVLCSVSLGR